MKKITIIAAMTAAMLSFSGCGVIENEAKHLHSSFTGLDRIITLYANDGKIIRQWSTKAKVEDRGGTCFFIVDGRAVTISGTFVIEEK